jgi:hypothetical protein
MSYLDNSKLYPNNTIQLSYWTSELDSCAHGGRMESWSSKFYLQF